MNRSIIETNRSFVKNQINKEVDKLFDEIKKLSLENEELKKDNKKLQENKTKLAGAYAKKIGLILTQKEYNRKFRRRFRMKTLKEYQKEYANPDMDMKMREIMVHKSNALKDVLKLIDEIKLPTDKDYKYSNEYIEEWIEELKLRIKGEK